MAESSVRSVHATKFDHARSVENSVDKSAVKTAEELWVSVEEPLEIQLVQPTGEREVLAVTMRTPGHEYELSVGFLLTEAIIQSVRDLGPVPLRDKLQTVGTHNVCVVPLTIHFDASSLKRNFYATSSCGVCGKASIDQLEKSVHRIKLDSSHVVSSAVLVSLPERLRMAQEQFSLTGGLHAVGLFDFAGNLLTIREDVGRHNAMDKAIGSALLQGMIPAGDRIAMVSGRLSFELVQKAALAGIAVLCAVSAPSSLAISAADRFGLTLVGFVREHRLTVFTHPSRVLLSQTTQW